MNARFFIFVFALSCFAFTSSTGNEKIVDVRVPSYTFSNWLEYEVLTTGEQNILLTITHESGRIMFKENRTLYGEAYLELDATDFPKGVYNITVSCKSTEANIKAEKI